MRRFNELQTALLSALEALRGLVRCRNTFSRPCALMSANHISCRTIGAMKSTGLPMPGGSGTWRSCVPPTRRTFALFSWPPSAVSTSPSELGPNIAALYPSLKACGFRRRCLVRPLYSLPSWSWCRAGFWASLPRRPSCSPYPRSLNQCRLRAWGLRRSRPLEYSPRHFTSITTTTPRLPPPSHSL